MLTVRRTSDGARPNGLRVVTNCVGVGLVVLSLVQQLRLPSDERTWHGLLFGRIPYDWRPPTLGRIRDAFWQPESSKVLPPTVFGVGWSINVGRILHPLLMGADRG
jgi:hypothetical protein